LTAIQIRILNIIVGEKRRPMISISRRPTGFDEESKQGTNPTPLKSTIPFSTILKLTLPSLMRILELSYIINRSIETPICRDMRQVLE
jgi:hypothetical protein